MSVNVPNTAYEIVVLDQSFPVSADLSAKQYYFVKMVSDGTVDVCSQPTDLAFGVLQNNPAAGQTAQVRTYGVSMVATSAAVNAGTQLCPSSAGAAISAIATSWVNGICLIGTTGSGQLASVLITNTGTY